MSSKKLCRFLFFYAVELLLCTKSTGGRHGHPARDALDSQFVSGAEGRIAFSDLVRNGSAQRTCPMWEERSSAKDAFVCPAGLLDVGTEMGRVSIRTMTFKDIRIVNRLGREMFTKGDFCSLGRTWDDFSVAELYVRSRELCFVAEATNLVGTTAGRTNMEKLGLDGNSTIVGFLLGREWSRPVGDPFGGIEWIAVVPEHRRMGVGTRLVRRFQAELRRLYQTSTVLARHAAADNIPAIRLLESSGLRHKIDYISLTLKMPPVTYERLNPKTSSLEYRYEPSTSQINGRRTANGTGTVSFTVRRITVDDLESIRALGIELFRDIPTLSREWNDEEILDHFLTDSDYSVVATVERNEGSCNDGRNDDDRDLLVGFSMGAISEDAIKRQNYGYIIWLGCSPEYQGLGVATELLKAMLELFEDEDVDTVIMDTQSDNIDALRFFRKLGFGDEEQHAYLSNQRLT